MTANKKTRPSSNDARLQSLMDSAIDSQTRKDYDTVIENSLKIIAISPDNPHAGLLLAMYDGWDQKLCIMNENVVANAVRRFFQKNASDCPYKEAQDIYEARREQIFCILDAEATMPSFSNTKEIHQTMLSWIRLLQKIPYLSPTLIKGEIERAERVCEQSRRSLDPRFRSIYTAYSMFNGKAPYSVTFSEALSPIIESATLRDQDNAARIISEAGSYSKLLENTLASINKQECISSAIDRLNKGTEAIEFAYGLPYYKKELDQLNDHLSSCSPFFVSVQRRIKQRIQVTTERLSNAERLCNPQLNSIKKTIDMLGGSLGQDA